MTPVKIRYKKFSSTVKISECKGKNKNVSQDPKEKNIVLQSLADLVCFLKDTAFNFSAKHTSNEPKSFCLFGSSYGFFSTILIKPSAYNSCKEKSENIPRKQAECFRFQ
jgi:hypothetical protein